MRNILYFAQQSKNFFSSCWFVGRGLEVKEEIEKKNKQNVEWDKESLASFLKRNVAQSNLLLKISKELCNFCHFNYFERMNKTVILDRKMKL